MGRGKRDIKKEAGMTSSLPFSQPFGEVFRKYSFSEIFFVLLPFLLLYSHQPTVILKTQTWKQSHIHLTVTVTAQNSV